LMFDILIFFQCWYRNLSYNWLLCYPRPYLQWICLIVWFFHNYNTNFRAVTSHFWLQYSVHSLLHNICQFCIVLLLICYSKYSVNAHLNTIWTFSLRMCQWMLFFSLMDYILNCDLSAPKKHCLNWNNWQMVLLKFVQFPYFCSYHIWRRVLRFLCCWNSYLFVLHLNDGIHW
jgi:hypothetical protein